jgi:DNA-binding NtrC family response regulator
VGQLAEAYEEPTKALSDEMVGALQRYSWPGNVRELGNAIEHAFVFAQNGCLTVADLPEAIRGPAGQDHPPACESAAVPSNGHGVVPLHVAERRLIRQALHTTQGNQTQAATLLEVERHRLSRMIDRHGLREFAKSLSA